MMNLAGVGQAAQSIAGQQAVPMSKDAGVRAQQYQAAYPESPEMYNAPPMMQNTMVPMQGEQQFIPMGQPGGTKMGQEAIPVSKDPTTRRLQFEGYNQNPQRDPRETAYMDSPFARNTMDYYNQETQRQETRFDENMGLASNQLAKLMSGSGDLYSGNYGRALAEEYSNLRPNMARPDVYGQYMGNLGQLATSGMGAATNLANLAGGNAANQSNIIQGTADSSAQNAANQAAISGNMVQNVAGIAGNTVGSLVQQNQYQQQLDAMQGPSTPTYSGTPQMSSWAGDPYGSVRP